MKRSVIRECGANIAREPRITLRSIQATGLLAIGGIRSESYSPIKEKNGADLKVLLELRPALDSHAGIPQETRLLFRGLRLIGDVDAEGLIIHSGRVLAKGLPVKVTSSTPGQSADREIYKLSRIIISLEQSLHPTLLRKTGIDIDRFTGSLNMVLTHLVGASQKLTRFDPTHFRDFIWRNFFAKTLPHSDFELVTKAKYRVARLPWTMMHLCGLNSKQFGYHFYPRLDTSEFNVLISQTPFPGTVSSETKLVVRYHDAIPVLMPHTISDKTFHQASHYFALKCNVKNGAYFACVSEATRKDLLSIFPEAADRAVTIHNMVSHHYFPEDSSPLRVPEIVRTRMHSSINVLFTGKSEVNSPADPDASAPIRSECAPPRRYSYQVPTGGTRKKNEGKERNSACGPAFRNAGCSRSPSPAHGGRDGGGVLLAMDWWTRGALTSSPHTSGRTHSCRTCADHTRCT